MLGVRIPDGTNKPAQKTKEIIAFTIAMRSRLLSFYGVDLREPSDQQWTVDRMVEAILGVESLYFRSTRVSDVGLLALTKQLQHLPALQSLYFSGTRVSDVGLRALAEQVRHLPALKLLDLLRTRVSVPWEILATKDARRIFEHVLGRERLLPEVKLLVVGQGEAGKTHLRKRLFVEPSDLTHHDDAEVRTHDIEMTVWSIKVELKKESGDENQESVETDIRCHVWDFGGQNHLHGSHRFFLGAEWCLYLLVLNATQNAEQNRLDYWLRLLAHHGRKKIGSGESLTIERAPVLIVITQCDRWELEGTTNNGFVDLVNALSVAQQFARGPRPHRRQSPRRVRRDLPTRRPDTRPRRTG